MKRIYHPYTRWEDYTAGMWRSISKEEEAALLPQAVEFTGDAALYGSFMQRVVREWPFSCEHSRPPCEAYNTIKKAEIAARGQK